MSRADQQPDTGEERLRNEQLVRQSLKEQQKPHLKDGRLKGDTTPNIEIQKYNLSREISGSRLSHHWGWRGQGGKLEFV